MRKGILSIAVICGFLAVGLMFDSAHARPKYMGAFGKKYEGLADKVKTVKCGVCHPEKDKKVRNDYGKAMGKHLTQKNEKDAAAIDKALDGAAGEKNSDGKTYGEVIEGGNLPG